MPLKISTISAYEVAYDEQNTSEHSALIDEPQIQEEETFEDDEQNYEDSSDQEDDESDLDFIDATDEESIPGEQVSVQAQTEILADELVTPLIEQTDETIFSSNTVTTDDVVDSNSAHDFMNVIYSFVVHIKNAIQSLFSSRM